MSIKNLLALDVGEKRIGLALGDSDVRIAVPFGYIERTEDSLVRLVEVILEHDIATVVIGYPRNQSGEPTHQTTLVIDFADELKKTETGVEIEFQDESLTSVEAERRLGQVKDRGEIDAEAASIILQDYLEGN